MVSIDNQLYAKVDQYECIGCGVCEGIAPRQIGLDEEGLAFIKVDNNLGKHEFNDDEAELVLEAVVSCPTGAIRVQKEAFSQEENNE